MKRPAIVRFQIIAIVALGVLVIWQPWKGGSEDAVLAMEELDRAHLYERSFRLESEAMLKVSGLASFENADSDELAAFPWILNESDRSVVWQPNLASVARDQTRGAFEDSLVLPAGKYVAYFATYGPTARSREDRSFLGLKPHWTNDSGRWYLRFYVDEPGVLIAETSDISPDPDLIWSSGPMRSRQSRSILIHATEATSLRLSATGESCSADCDFAWIENAISGERFWRTTRENTEYAGGMPSNRSFDGSVAVQPGVYRVGYTTDGSHAYGSWRGNPPYDPTSWGVKLWADEGAVQIFDPWDSEQPVIAMHGIGDNEVRSTVFKVSSPISAVISAVGEIGDGGTVYDYAWLECGEEREKVWVMSRDRSEPAGGSSTNREELAFMQLEPGTYGLYYQSDGSHSAPEFRNGTPEHPERWGVALFAVESDAVENGLIEVLEDRPMSDNGMSSDPSAPLPTVGEPLMSELGVGNQEERTASFTLDRPTRLKIIALGEISQNGRYDYGWIQSESGDYVWEMTIQNTSPAGGSDRNRIFEGTITLGAGSYEGHYVSDFSHSFGDFSDAGPPRSERWGMQIIPVVE